MRVTVCMSQLVRALRLLQSVVFLVEILHSWISDFNPYAYGHSRFWSFFWIAWIRFALCRFKFALAKIFWLEALWHHNNFLAQSALAPSLFEKKELG